MSTGILVLPDGYLTLTLSHRFVDRDMLMRYMGSGIGHKHSVPYQPETLAMEPSHPLLDEEIANILELPNLPIAEVTGEGPFTIEDDIKDEMVEEETPNSDIEDDDSEVESSDIDEEEGYISH